jgi:hypothetical protein
LSLKTCYPQRKGSKGKFKKPGRHEFVQVPELTTPSPFKPSFSTLSLGGQTTENEKSLLRLIRKAETGLETMTNNVIQNRVILKDQYKVLRGLESWLDMVQDQIGETLLGLSSELVAPTLNSRVAILAEKVSLLKPSATPNMLVAQVLTWVNQWWSVSGSKLKIILADDFSRDCGNFLTSFATSFQTQAG